MAMIQITKMQHFLAFYDKRTGQVTFIHGGDRGVMLSVMKKRDAHGLLMRFRPVSCMGLHSREVYMGFANHPS